MSFRKLYKALATLLVAAIILCDPGSAYGLSVVNSKHNLSASGPGPVRAVRESGVCIFCHTPHNSSPRGYLWSRDEPSVTYNPYKSSTMKAFIGQPTGASKLCLSCHDGTVALGLVRSRRKRIAMGGGIITMPPGRSSMGTDLSDDHPISFSYDSLLLSKNRELANPAVLRGRVRLEDDHLLQCTSCHDPHNDQYGKFLVMNNAYSALCTTCHQKKDWATSSHNTSNRPWNGAGDNPWPHTNYDRVDVNGCMNCHRSHSAGSWQRLLKAQAEEDNCFPCHNGNVAKKNIEAEFTKAYAHSVGSTTGVHDPTESIAIADLHVECVDCHNPHVTRSGTTSPPLVSSSMRGVSGVDSAGNPVAEARYQYQVCYKCHAFWSDNPPSIIPRTLNRITRQFPQNNLRISFNPSNLSFHPVAAKGRNPDVPSLRSPYNTTSLISCTDCHNNDGGPGAGGTGPRGPHGSNNPFLLERRLETKDLTGESQETYALCYKCHERSNILSNQSFKLHEKHIVEEKTPCTVCHDSHGVPNQSRLINFDLSVATPSKSGNFRFERLGQGKGRCFLKCHDKEHDPKDY